MRGDNLEHASRLTSFQDNISFLLQATYQNAPHSFIGVGHENRWIWVEGLCSDSIRPSGGRAQPLTKVPELRLVFPLYFRRPSLRLRKNAKQSVMAFFHLGERPCDVFPIARVANSHVQIIYFSNSSSGLFKPPFERSAPC